MPRRSARRAARQSAQESPNKRDGDAEERLEKLQNELHDANDKLHEAETDKEALRQDAQDHIDELAEKMAKLTKQADDFELQINQLQEEKYLAQKEAKELKERLGQQNDQIHNSSMQNVPTQSEAGSMHIPLPRQSEYDGKKPWERFIKQFKALSHACGWSEEETRFRLVNSLRDEAAEYAFEVLPGHILNSVDLLQQALQERFGERKTTNAYLSLLENKKLAPKETLSEYAADIRRLVSKGYPTADGQTHETIALRHFIKGLTDQNMIVAVGMKDPKTLDDARAAVEMYLSLKDEMGKPITRNIRAVASKDPEEHTEEKKPEASANYVTTAQFEELLASLDGRFRGLAKLLNGNKQKAGNKNDSSFRCYQCDGTGHYARNCPNKVSGDNKSDNKSRSASAPSGN